jgi:hypothetical protein
MRHDILNDENRTLSTGLYGEALPSYQAKVQKVPAAKSGEGYLEKVTNKVVSIF